MQIEAELAGMLLGRISYLYRAGTVNGGGGVAEDGRNKSFFLFVENGLIGEHGSVAKGP